MGYSSESFLRAQSVSQIKSCVHFFGDLPIFSDVRPLFAAIFPLLSPITRCSRAMQVIRDASTKSAKRTLEPTGNSPGTITHSQRGAQTPSSHRPDTELVVPHRRVMICLCTLLIPRLDLTQPPRHAPQRTRNNDAGDTGCKPCRELITRVVSLING